MNQHSGGSLDPNRERDVLLNSSIIEQLKTTCGYFEKVCNKLVEYMEQSQRQITEIKTYLKGEVGEKLDRLVNTLDDKNSGSSSFKNQHTKPLSLVGTAKNQKSQASRSPTRIFMKQERMIEKKKSPSQQEEFKKSQKQEENQKQELRSKMSAKLARLNSEQIAFNTFDLDSRSEIRHLDSIDPKTPSDYIERPSSPVNTTVSTFKKQKSFLIKVPQDDKNQFLKVVRSKIGEFYAKHTEELYEKFRKREINYTQLKIRFSWAVESYGFDQTEVFVNTKAGLQWLTNNSNTVRVVGLLDSYHRNILEYLIMKYPPSQNKIVDIELSRKIKEISKHNDPQYEMLNNAGVSFSNKTNNKDFTKEIKIWLNILTKEVKKQFPKFSQKMRIAFLNHDTSLSETDMSDVVEYEIGTKISQSTGYYTADELEQPDLNLKSLEILRVLMKWIEELMKYFENTTLKVLNNKGGFKSVSHGQTIILSSKRKEALAEKLDQIFKKVIKKKQQENHRDMLTIIADLYIMLENGFSGCEEVNEREVKTGKIAELFSDSAASYTQKILNDLIFALNGVGEMYSGNSLESGLDLVTFGVMDILRCRCVGSKQEIFRIYSQICEMKDYLEVIRVKNKLNENTRDILINFKLKDSFMICQMQLALGKCRQQINDNFCHNLYEVSRSTFPILIEHGIRLSHLDPRSKYFRTKFIELNCTKRYQTLKNNVTVKANKIYCNNNHAQKEFSYIKNNIPFCCYYCASYIKAYSYSIEFVRCPECMQAVCPNCLLGNFGEFQYVYLERYVCLDDVYDFIQHEPFYVGFCGNSKLQQKLKDALSRRSYVFVFKFDRIGLKKNTFKIVNKQLTRSFSTLQELKLRKIRDSQLNWDAIVIPGPIIEVSLEELKYYEKTTMIDLSYFELEKSFKKNGITKVLAILNRASKRALIVDIIENEEQISLIRRRNEAIRKVELENEKEDISIEITNEKLPDLKLLDYVKNKNAVKSMNLSENQIRELKELVQFPNLLELHITQNQVRSLHEISCLNNLQYLNCQMNKLERQMPILNFQGVRSLDLSHNHIASFSNLSSSFLPHLRTLILSYNEFTDTAVLNLPSLEIFDLSSNLIKSIDNLSLSTLPFAHKIDCSNNKIEGELPLIKSESLEVLKLDHNKLTGVGALQKAQLPSLEILGLSDNAIQGTLPRIKMPALEKLDMSMNQIVQVAELMLSQLNKLKWLDLSHNSIEGELPPISYPSLQTLNFSCNRLSNINFLTDSKIQLLIDLNLSRNSIDCIPLLDAQHLTNLDLSQNRIDSVSNLEHCSLPCLATLDLSFNRIACSMPVLFMPQLTTVNLDNNDVTELLFLDEKQLVPKLATVFIKNNKRVLVKENNQVDGKIRCVSRKSITFREK